MVLDQLTDPLKIIIIKTQFLYLGTITTKFMIVLLKISYIFIRV